MTHVACAFDHVIESFRNELYPGYKTGAGVDPELLAQFPLAEEAVSALGVVVWPMVEFEADDALATAAARFSDAQSVEQMVVCSPDKDLAQSVRRRPRRLLGSPPGRRARRGRRGGEVRRPPASIPDWLALVGDAADGYPGIPGWGAKSASAVLARFGHLDAIPDDPAALGFPAARAARLVESLRAGRDEARLFLRLATLRLDVPISRRSSTSSGAASHPALPGCVPSSATKGWRGASRRPAAFADGPPATGLPARRHGAAVRGLSAPGTFRVPTYTDGRPEVSHALAE